MTVSSTYEEAYEEGKRRWEHKNGGPDTLLEAAQKEHFARDFAYTRFNCPAANAKRLEAYKNLKRHGGKP